MSFSQSSITSVNPPVQNGTQLLLSWLSTAPAGTIYQVYLDQRLVWSGVGLACSIPLPLATARIDVGTIDAASAQINAGSQLPATPARCATLTWMGGTFLGTDIAGFHVYGESTPGGGIDYTNVLATVPAYIAGIVTDGFGYGGFGQGGFGQAAGQYTWTSQPLAAGSWNWAVEPFDTAGNKGAAQTTVVTIVTPPQAAAPFANGTRLQRTYNASNKQVTLTWNASPG